MKTNMIYGTAWKKEKTDSLVALAITSGFRFIDTACQPKHYQEKLVGDGIAQALKTNNLLREELFIQTKFTPLSGQDPNNIPYNPNETLENQIKTSLAVSLTNLQTSYLDSLLLHSPIYPFGELLKAWGVFEEFYKDKQVLNLGISNCYDINLFKKLYESSTIKPTFLQNRFYKDSNYDKELRLFCKEHNITYQSFWSLTANIEILNSSLVLKLATKYQKTQPQILYRFLNHIGIIPLNGTTNEIHMKEDLDIGSFSLTDDEIDAINGML